MGLRACKERGKDLRTSPGPATGHRALTWIMLAFCTNMLPSCLIMHLLRVFILLSKVLSGCILALHPIKGRTKLSLLISNPQTQSAGKFDGAKVLVWSTVSLSFRPPGHVHVSIWPSIYFRFLRLQRNSGSLFPKDNGQIHPGSYLSWIMLPRLSPSKSSVRWYGFTTSTHLPFLPILGHCAKYKGMKVPGGGWRIEGGEIPWKERDVTAFKGS